MARPEGARAAGKSKKTPPPDDRRARPGDPDRPVRDDPDRPVRDDRPGTTVMLVKTSAAAAFALAFGVAALLSVLSLVLSPLGLVFAVIGLILGIIGIGRASRPGLTGKGVAIAGLVTSVITLILIAVAAVGITTFLNDDEAVERLENRIEQLQDQAPEDVEIQS